MATATDKLTQQALKQHDNIHPTFKAIPTGGAAGDAPASTRQKATQSGGSTNDQPTGRRRTTSMLSETVSSPSTKTPHPPAPGTTKSSMSIFRLVAATRTWQRLAKQKRESAPGPIPVRYENSYRLEPDSKTKFSPPKVEAIIKDVLESRLRNVRYNAEQCRRAATDLAGVIKARTKTCDFRRYKLVCNVLVMENKGQGSQIVSRGLTNTDTDSFAAYTYQSPTLVAVAHVYGVYFE